MEENIQFNFVYIKIYIIYNFSTSCFTCLPSGSEKIASY